MSIHNFARKLESSGRLLNLVVWLSFVAIALNVIAFTLQSSNPALMADDWYFLDVFVRKAIDHSLNFSYFFVHRAVSDHAEPLIKVVIFLCYKFFHLDLSVEALVGAFIALAYALVFRFLVVNRRNATFDWVAQIAWLTIAAALLSLNSAELWSWAENSMQYSSDIMIPVFLWSVWRAYTKRVYALLPVITFIMGVVGDDNGVICVIATVIAMGLHFFIGRQVDKRSIAIVLAEIIVTMVLVRIGYQFAPVVGGVRVSPIGNLHALYNEIIEGHWRAWIMPPLVWGVISRSIFPVGAQYLFKALVVAVFTTMLALQVWFWIKAFRAKWNSLTFIAICLMIIVYGWMAGILIYRAPVFGVHAFSQTRYVRLYEFEVISLALMWVGSTGRRDGSANGKWSRLIGTVACLAFLALQIPLSVTAWRLAPYIRGYYQQQAQQTYGLAVDPNNRAILKHCNAQLQLCGMPVSLREDLLGLLRENQLGIFSGSVVRAHPLLLTATSSLNPSMRTQLISKLRESSGKMSVEATYGKALTLVQRKGEGWPESTINVHALRSSVVPLLLSGCWPSDRTGNFVSSWCGPNVSLVLHRPEGISDLRVQGWFPWSLNAKAGRISPVAITISVDGVEVARKYLASDGMFHIDVPRHVLPDASWSGDLLFIKVSADSDFVPSSFSSSPDSRKLAMKLSGVGFM